MRGRKRLHHDVFLEEERRAPDFVAATGDDERLCPACDLTKTRLASQAAQAVTCQSSESDSRRMRFSWAHAGQTMVIGNFCSSSFSFHIRPSVCSIRSGDPFQGITLAQTARSATRRIEDWISNKEIDGMKNGNNSLSRSLLSPHYAYGLFRARSRARDENRHNGSVVFQHTQEEDSGHGPMNHMS